MSVRRMSSYSSRGKSGPFQQVLRSVQRNAELLRLFVSTRQKLVMPQTSSPTHKRGNHRHYKCCYKHRFRGSKGEWNFQEPGKAKPHGNKRSTPADRKSTSLN